MSKAIKKIIVRGARKHYLINVNLENHLLHLIPYMQKDRGDMLNLFPRMHVNL